MKLPFLLWSTKKPVVPGYYFYRRGKHIDVCKVYQIDVENPQYAFKKDNGLVLFLNREIKASPLLVQHI